MRKTVPAVVLTVAVVLSAGNGLDGQDPEYMRLDFETTFIGPVALRIRKTKRV